MDMIRAKSDPTVGLFHQQNALRSAAAIELVPTNYFAPLDVTTVFPRPAPLEVDLGCGDGLFLVAMAAKFPDRNFLGIERMLGRVHTACRRAARQAVNNVRVLLLETSYAVEYLLPPGSTSVAHLLFPDPWPKKKHQRRRVVTKDFLAAIHRSLTPDGCFHIATDQADYFAAIRGLIVGCAFVEEPAEEEEIFPLTTFEKRFRAVGAPIYRLVLRKTF